MRLRKVKQGILSLHCAYLIIFTPKQIAHCRRCISVPSLRRTYATLLLLIVVCCRFCVRL